MNNELVKIEQLPMAEIQTISKTFFESGLFADTKSAAQAMVRILAGQEIGIPPFAAMSGIHIIQGKPTIGAGIIASRVKGSGKYDYTVVKMDEKICSLDFTQNGKVIGNSTFTLDDAKKAGTKNLDKFPKNMLFARAISNGVKWFCPDVFSGPVYTPEEMENVQVTVDIPHTDVPDTRELDSAIDKLPLCTTVPELKELKSQLPAYIVEDASFKDAAKKQYKVVMASAPTTN